MKIAECEGALDSNYVNDMNAKLRQAQATDRQNMGETTVEELKRARKKLLTGETDVTDPFAVSEYDKATLEIIGEIQSYFKNLIVRRTIWSRDPDGNPIWKAEDPIEQIIMLTLSPEEEKIVNKQAAKHLTDKTLGWKKVRFIRFRIEQPSAGVIALLSDGAGSWPSTSGGRQESSAHGRRRCAGYSNEFFPQQHAGTAARSKHDAPFPACGAFVLTPSAVSRLCACGPLSAPDLGEPARVQALHGTVGVLAPRRLL